MKPNSSPSTEKDSPQESPDASYSHVLKYTSLLGGVQGFYILMAVIRNKLTAILIGVIGVGLIDLYSRTIELLSNTTNFGISFSAVPKISQLYDEGNHRELRHQIRLVRTLAVFTALLGIVLGLIAAPWLSLWLKGNYDSTWAFCMLTPAVGFTAMTSGETAILKGTRQLKTIAAISAMGALGTLLITVPIYFSLGIKGVIPVIVANCALILGLHLRATTRAFPYRLMSISHNLLHKGGPILRLGFAYISAGILGSGAEMLIRAIMVKSDGGLQSVGLYAAGLTLVVSYARIIFVTMDSDYFPRLSVAIQDKEKLNVTVNRQIEVLVLLMVPFLIVFSLSLPLVLNILYTESFLPVIPMVICALPYMFLKAIYSPIAYMPLASGDSRLYFLMEFIYDVFFTLIVIGGYHFGGLVGAGCGLTLANLMDTLLLPIVYKKKYGFCFDKSTIKHCLLQGILLAIGLALSTQTSIPAKAIGGTLLCALSGWVSWRLLRNETYLSTRLTSLFSKIKRKP